MSDSIRPSGTVHRSDATHPAGTVHTTESLVPMPRSCEDLAAGATPDPSGLVREAANARRAGRALRRDSRSRYGGERDLLRAEQRAEVAGLRVEHLAERLVHDEHLAHPAFAVVQQFHERVHAAVLGQLERGATVHRRLPRTVRGIPPVVAVADGIVLLAFCADVFNVDWARPNWIRVLAAIMLALLGSGVSYAWLALTGLRMRTYRGELGEVIWAATGALTRAMLAISVVVAVALAVLMFARVGPEVAQAGKPTDVAMLVGIVFAVLSFVANLTVVAVHALDASPIAQELRHAGRVLRRRQRALARRREAAVREIHRHARMAQRAQQAGERTAAAVPVTPSVQVGQPVPVEVEQHVR